MKSIAAQDKRMKNSISFLFCWSGRDADCSVLGHLIKSISQSQAGKGQKLKAVWMNHSTTVAFWAVSLISKA